MEVVEVAADPLAGLNPEQRAAAAAVSGPVCILAGPGTGKTRTVTHRIAQQVRSGTVPAAAVLAVTFTDRAAAELRHRLAGLEIPSIRAATFHAAAWAQLRFFWPQAFGGALPEVLASKVPLLVRTARRERVEAMDLAAEIEWAKARRLAPEAYAEAAAGRDAPLEPDAMADVYRAYEAEKQSRNAIDYEDMLLLTADLLARDQEAATEVRDRYRAFTVDEVQDCNPAQWALLEQWLGGRDDLCVVGDPDQQIFTFTGASAEYLHGFHRRFPRARVVRLRTTYRCSPQVLAVAGGLRRGARDLVSAAPGGPPVSFAGHPDADAETKAVVEGVRALLDAGTPAGAIAVCYRTNSQSAAYEEALAAAAIPFMVRGDTAFAARPEVRQALAALDTAVAAGPVSGTVPPVGDALPIGPPDTVRWADRVLRDALRFHPDREPSGARERERWRNLTVLRGLLTDCATTIGAQGVSDFRAEDAEIRQGPHVSSDFHAEDADIRQGFAHHAEVVAALRGRLGTADVTAGADAVSLLTLHKAKGTEFDAVFLVGIEEGLLPISHAKLPEDVTEEARLLYVGVTRARHHLSLSWAAERAGWGGRVQRRRPSRFLYGLGPGAPARGETATARKPKQPRTSPAAGDGDPALVEALRAWRLERSRADAVPAFVVFSDATLEELAARRPASPRELLAVAGIGPTKVERYGEPILRVISDAG